MTPSAELALIRTARLRCIAALGPKPGWWRPFKRRAWLRALGELCKPTPREIELAWGTWEQAFEKLMGAVGDAVSDGGAGRGEMN